MKIKLLGWADIACHKMFDWYINAKPFGHHLPAWGLIQLWQWRLCNYYENVVDALEPVRVGTLADSEHGAETCKRCGGENVIWAAPSPLWNYVMRGNDINGESLYGDMVCIRCFIVLAEEKGIHGIPWRVTVDPEPDGLIYETPSGRVWDSDNWLWVNPDQVV